MVRLSPSRLLLAAIAAAAACQPRLGPGVDAPGRAVDAEAVALFTEGSAFERADVRALVTRGLERSTGRRVLPLGAPVGLDEPEVKALAARVTLTHPAVRPSDWRARACAAEHDVLTALHRNVDAVYRVSLDYAAPSSPLGPSDPRPGAWTRMLGVLGLASPGTVREETLDGHIEMIALTADGRVRTPLSHAARHVAPSTFTPRLDVGAALDEALAALPPPPAPAWRAVADRLVGAGCPAFALMVAERRLTAAGDRRAVERRALAALARTRGRHARDRQARQTAAAVRVALREGRIDEAVSLLARYEAHPARRAETARELAAAVAAARGMIEPAPAAPPRDDAVSCDTLCRVHMVQLCNNDKMLWTSHRAAWEATPCGTKRPEPFLQDCYRQQWLSGTFRHACLEPCRRGPEGRVRLMKILSDGGCVRLGIL